MRKLGLILGLALLVSLPVTAAHAGSPPQGAQKQEAGFYSGEVSELDLKANRMVVEQKNTDLAMIFNTSKAKSGSGYQKLSDVKLGDQVKIKFEARAGTIYALSVSKGEKPAPKPAPAKKPHP